MTNQRPTVSTGDRNTEENRSTVVLSRKNDRSFSWNPLFSRYGFGLDRMFSALAHLDPNFLRGLRIQ